MREIQRKRFGKYLLLDRVATGGMAELFRAKFSGEEGFEKLVAVKRILPHLAVQEELVTAFIEEAKLAALLEHQNLVRIFDFGSMGESFFIAMEYLYGRDLRGIGQRGKTKEAPLSLENALYIVSRVCAGLAYAHNRKDFMGRPLNLVHRDISPQNIFITWEGEVKILDFGIAKAATRSSMTQVGIIKGKVAYMSPEQAAGRPMDHRSDIFSTGILLHELVTGERMFEGETLEILRRVQNAEYRPARQVREDLPPCLIKILDSALAKDVDSRYQSCSDMLVDLEECTFVTSLRPSTQGLAKYIRFLFQEDMATEEVELKEIAGISDEGSAEWAVTKTMPTLETGAPAPPEAEKTPEKSGWMSGVKGLLMIAAGILVLGLGALFVWWNGDRPAETTGQTPRVATATPAETGPAPATGQPITVAPGPESPAAREAARQKQIAGLLASAKGSLEASKTDEAEGFYKQLLELDAGNEVAKAGLQQVKELRERAAREAARQKQIAGLLASAKQSLEASRADEAEGFYQQLLELDAGSAEAKAGLQQVKELRGRLAREAARQEQIAGLLASAKGSLEASKTDEAEGFYKQLLELDAGNEVAKAGLQQVKELRERLAREAARQKQIAGLLASAKGSLEASRADEAEGFYQQLLELDAGNEVAKAGLQQVKELRERLAREAARQEQIAGLLASAKGSLEASRADEAEGFYQQLLELDAGNEVAKAGLQQVKELRERLAREAARQEQIAGLLASAKGSLEASRADEAEGFYQQLLELDAGSTEAKAGLQQVKELRERLAREAARQEQIAGLLASGREALKVLKADEAEGYFKRVLELEPGNGEAGSGLQLVQDLKERVAREMERRRQITSLLSSARESLEASRADEAEGFYKEVLALESDSAEAKAGLQQVKELRERLAREAARQKQIAGLLASAKQSLEASRADEAEGYFKEVLALESGSAEAKAGLQQVKELRERLALEAERKKQIAGLLASAKQSLEASRADEAEGFFKQLQELDAGSAEAKAGLLAVQKLREQLAVRATLRQAEEALAKKLFAEAIGLFGEAMTRAPELAAEISPAYAQALQEQAMAIAPGNPGGAESLLRKAIELDPKNARGHFLLGLNHFGKKEHAKAIAAYQEAAKLNPQSADTFFNLGYTYALLGDLEKAEKMYRRTVELAPSYMDEALFNLAMVQDMRGKAKECRDNLEKAVLVNPDNKTAKEMLEKPNVCSRGKK